MLNQNDVLALRDLALDHLPKVVAQRDIAAQHSRRCALQSVAFSPLRTAYNPASTVIELQASRLLMLVGEHPETHYEYLVDGVNDGSLGITVEQALADAQKIRPLIEKHLLEAAQELCRLSGALLPHSIAVPVQDDCRVLGYDSHTLADALIDTPREADTPPQAAPANDTGNGKPRYKWDEHALRKLLIENMEPGMTQTKLGERYRVSRSFIGAMLKKARNELEPKVRSALDPSRWRPKK